MFSRGDRIIDSNERKIVYEVRYVSKDFYECKCLKDESKAHKENEVVYLSKGLVEGSFKIDEKYLEYRKMKKHYQREEEQKKDI